MNVRSLPLIAILSGLTVGCEPAPSPGQQGSGESGLQITAPFAYPAAAGEPVGVTYLNIINHGPEDDRLVSAHSEVAARIELHETSEVDGVMQMRHREDGFPLPAGHTLTMEPGDLHLMLMEIQFELPEGQAYQLTLEFEKAGRRTVEVPIRNDIDQR